MLGFVCIFLSSFICFGAVVYGYMAEYARDEAVGSVQSAAHSAKIMMDSMWQNFFEKEDPNAALGYDDFIENESVDIRVAIEGIAKFTDVGILVLDEEGKVAVTTVKGTADAKAPEGFFEGLFDEKDSAKGYTSKNKKTVGNLVTKKSYLSVVKLSGDESYYVLAYNLVDSETVIISNLVQSISVSVFVVFLLGFAACYIISYHMITPLKDMSRAAKRFAKGDFNARVTVKGEDEIAELATAFNNMAQSLSELEEQRSSFLANVSHDLRTPMTSISGFIDGILDGTIPPENRDHYLNIVSVEIKRLSRLVRTLLDLSRIQCGERKFTMVNFDVSEMAMMILFSFESQIEAKKLEIEFEGAERTFVLADSDAIHQVLYNLIDNAVKFSYESGVLRVRLTEHDKNVSIEVYNEGKGIPECDLPHVFDRFYKADKSRGLDKTGVGLGLFIVKAILQAHGENITVASEEGKNCCFTLTLPKGSDPAGADGAKRRRG
ncbi:MAG: HAMP domain-containing histidine kinase [Clostridia bacterium]|nr:HAMP domain-containing histidine kinase [Clostridia bacterium]